MIFARCLNECHIALAYTVQGIILNVSVWMTGKKGRIRRYDTKVSITIGVVRAVYALYAAVAELDQVALVDRRSVAIVVLII